MIAFPETITFNRSGWTWRLRDSSVLDPWFEQFLDGETPGEVLRSNSGKDVFRVISYERPLLVRSYHPKRTFSRLRSRMAPRAGEEYDAFLLLEDCEIPAVECLGWGRRGPDSLTILRDEANSMNARDFWFSNVQETPATLRQPFLVEFARAIGRLVAEGVHHPDLRLGRFIVSGDPFQFKLAEPCGVNYHEKFDAEMGYSMLRGVAELRGEINTGEAAAIIMYAGVEQDASKVVEIWRSLLRDATAEVESLWPKRRAQFLAADPRFCIASEGLLLRCGMDGYPMLSPEELNPAVLDRFDRLDFKNSPDEAMRIWLSSFKLMLHRVNHRVPVMMELNPDGAPCALHVQRRDGMAANSHTPLKEFSERCEMIGIDPSLLIDNIQVVDGRLEIIDIATLGVEV